MAGRLRRGQAQRELLLQRAIDASDLERRRIAGDLHDGVVQDMVGVAYELSAQAGRVEDPTAASALRDGASLARDSVRALRALLPDIYPPALHRTGLAAALEDLATTTSARGLPTSVRIDDSLELPEPMERLLFRAAQEALRNAAAHSGASAVAASVALVDGTARLEVADDGRGFDRAVLDERPGEGHFGLQLIGDLVRDAGGRAEIDSAPGRGTVVRVEVPVT